MKILSSIFLFCSLFFSNTSEVKQTAAIEPSPVIYFENAKVISLNPVNDDNYDATFSVSIINCASFFIESIDLNGEITVPVNDNMSITTSFSAALDGDYYSEMCIYEEFTTTVQLLSPEYNDFQNANLEKINVEITDYYYVPLYDQEQVLNFTVTSHEITQSDGIVNNICKFYPEKYVTDFDRVQIIISRTDVNDLVINTSLLARDEFTFSYPFLDCESTNYVFNGLLKENSNVPIEPDPNPDTGNSDLLAVVWLSLDIAIPVVGLLIALVIYFALRKNTKKSQ